MASRLPARTRVNQRGTRLRVITTSAAEEARDWGLHFRRSANPPGNRCLHLLASRLGCLGAGRRDAAGAARRWRCLRHPRSEEHTSELQSLMRISYAVFCLKKKKSKT